MASLECYQARSRWSWRRALEMDEFGLVECFALGGRRRHWWSELRGVRWLREGEALITTTRGEILLDRRSGDVAELVACVERFACAGQTAWGSAGIPSEAIEAWLGQSLPYRYDTLPPPERVRNVAIGVAAGIYAVALVTFGAPFAWIGGLVLAAGIANLCLSGVYLCAGEQGIELQTDHGRAWFDWRQVSACNQEDDNHGNTTVRVQIGNLWHQLLLPTTFATPLVCLLAKVVEANHATFTDAGDQPISDAALSQVRMTADPSVERGLSRSDEPAAQDTSASSS